MTLSSGQFVYFWGFSFLKEPIVQWKKDQLKILSLIIHWPQSLNFCQFSKKSDPEKNLGLLNEVTDIKNFDSLHCSLRASKKVAFFLRMLTENPLKLCNNSLIWLRNNWNSLESILMFWSVFNLQNDVRISFWIWERCKKRMKM